MIDYIKSALGSIWNNKVRSILTVLGVVIGVSSVTILISLGQGLKKDVSNLIQGLGTNVITIIGGKIDLKSGAGANQTNPANLVSGDILTLEDVKSIQAMDGIETVSPVTLVNGNLKKDDKTVFPTVMGADANILTAFQVLKIEDGHMFTADDDKSKVIVISQDVKEALFNGGQAVGEKVDLGKEEFTIVGVFGKNKSSSAFASELDRVSLIPFGTATDLNKGEVKIFRIVAKARDDADAKTIGKQIHEVLLKNHGEENFTVLTQEDILDLFSQFLNMATALVSAIAAISLIVGGIGIMNIMLVTVSERTKEIGLRKAVGATKGAILFQFLVEAIVVTLLGGILGLAISFAASAIVASQTPLTPEISLPVVLIAVGISTLVGVLFGLWPALRAANKDPIEALRYE